MPLIARARDRVTSMGRPITYSSELAAIICERLAAGESLRAICRDLAVVPESTVRTWVIDDVEGFAAQYARAREIGLDAMAEEMLAIADTTQEGTTTTSKEWGEEIKTGDMLEHRKLRVDARKWYLSKLAPKKYGDKLEIDAKVDVSLADRLTRARGRTGGN